MPKKTLQLYRGTTAQNDAYTGAQGEVTMDTTTKELRVHDGSTAGGHKVAKDSNVVHLAGTETITGIKTLAPSTAEALFVKSTVIDKTVTPNSNQHVFTDYRDKNNVRLGVIGEIKRTDGRYGMYMQCGNVGSIALTAKDDDTGLQLDLPQVSYLASVPTNVTSGTTDRAVPSMGWVNDATKATNVVHRDSNETISGVKTFRESCIVAKNPAIDNEVAPSSTQYITAMNIVDKNIKTMGMLSFAKGTNGNNTVKLFANGQSGGSTTYTSYIEIGCEKDGTSPWVSTITPAASDNSTKIATTAWCRGHGILIASQMPTSSNNYTWYRKYSDGWVEQGGKTTSANNASVTLPIAMSDANYTVVVAKEGSESTAVGVAPHDMTSTGFQIKICYNSSLSKVMDWHVSGLAA